MKATGIVRKIDELGRIVLPMELRKTMSIQKFDGIEIYVEQDTVVLKKYRSTCIFCENRDDLMLFKNQSICPECLKILKR